ncbi:hypothetical protein [Moraxella lacunata]|uniref:hypothetical protein n=1 Tax=Moraxella lacunata TaxID=477 RepID=UPI003EDEF706
MINTNTKSCHNDSFFMPHSQLYTANKFEFYHGNRSNFSFCRVYKCLIYQG